MKYPIEMNQYIHGSLNVGDFVTVFTNDFWQCDFANFSQLSFRKSYEGIAILIPETIAFSQVSELNSNDTGKSGPNQASMKGCLCQTTWNKIKKSLKET